MLLIKAMMQKNSREVDSLLSQVNYATKLLTSFGFRIVLVDIRLAVVGMLKAQCPEAPEYNLSFIFGWDKFTRVELCRNKFVIAQWVIPQTLLPTVMQAANSLVNELSSCVVQ